MTAPRRYRPHGTYRLPPEGAQGARFPGACADETTNFSESGVSVWNDPYHPTTVLTVASSGQAFFTYDPWVSDGTRVTCDNGVSTTYWYQGKTTGVPQGWVPDCYLNGEPS
jgi:hypothetical protein